MSELGASAGGDVATGDGGSGARDADASGGVENGVLTNTSGTDGALAGGKGGAGPSGANGAGARGGASGRGGAGSGVGGARAGAGGARALGGCAFSVSAQTADELGPGGIPTVGVVDWSVNLAKLESARIVFGEPNGAALTAPVDPSDGPNFHTLLLGMKPSKTYAFHVEVSDGKTTCTSEQQSITTGAVPNAIGPITRMLGPSAAAQARGYLITIKNNFVVILDADADPVWWAPAPAAGSRAQMSYDGQYLWMIAVNVGNQTPGGGDVERVSMDGLASTGKIASFANCHHDLTALPDGKIACLSWIRQNGNQPSDLLEGDADGNVTTVARLDAAYYNAPSYHANSLHYHASDQTYTLGDRQPNLFIKLKRTGELLWQFGGDCTGAPAPQCVPGTWKVNHGHQLLDDGSGTFLFFNNGQSGPATIFQYHLDESAQLSATLVWSYSPGFSSVVLGDVQSLPNGNTLVTFSLAGVIQELDPSQALVQSLSNAATGYVEWRDSLYGPPPRL
jgi:hypothetical protein